MILDYQRSACYAWEDRHIHPNDTGTVPFEQAQAIVDYVWPILFYPRVANCYGPKVKGLVTQANSIYNGQRFEDLWLDN